MGKGKTGANRVSAGEAVRRPANPLYVGSSHTDLRRGPLFQFPEKNGCQATRWKRHPKPRSHRLLTLVVAGTLPSPCQAGTIFFPQLGQTTLPHSEPVCGRWGDTNNDKAEVRGAGSFLAVWRCTGLLGNCIQNVKRPPMLQALATLCLLPQGRRGSCTLPKAGCTSEGKTTRSSLVLSK